MALFTERLIVNCEKATKFEKNLPLVLRYAHCSVTSKQVEDFDKFCGLFRKSELYLSTDCAFIFLNSVVYDKNVEVTARYDF